MSHPKDIDQQMPGERDLLLLDLLYGELDDDERDRALADDGPNTSIERSEGQSPGASDDASGNGRTHGDLQSDLEAFSNLRALFRELPDEEPAPAITTKLLHAAALHAPKSSRAQAATKAATKAMAADGTEKRGFFAWLAGLIQPVLMHPGLAAAASLLLIVAVTGTIYMSGKEQFAEPQLPASSPTPSADMSAAKAADKTLPVASEGAPGMEALAEEDDAELSRAVAPRPEANLDELEQLNAKDRRRSAAKTKGKRPRAGKKSSRKNESARIGRPYEGEPISKSDSRGADRDRASTRGVAGGGSTPTKTSRPPASIAVGESTFDQTNRADFGTASIATQAQAPSPAPPPAVSPADDADADSAEAPAPRREKSPPKRKKKRASKKSSKTPSKKPAESPKDQLNRIRSLHDEARDAAASKNCSTVREAGNRIKRIDPGYYRNTFRRDKALAACFPDK